MDMEVAQSYIGWHSDYAVSLVTCCHCEQLVREPVMLDCLHTCCRSCLTRDTTREPTLQSSSCLECPVCCVASEHSAVTLNSLLCNYKRLSALSLEAVSCSACDGVDVAAAVYWCTNCFRALCVSCYSWHNSFHRRHRSAELEVARLWPLSQLMPGGQCDSHQRAMREYCFTCRRPQCFLCSFSLCMAIKHRVYPLSHEETAKHMLVTITNIRARKEQLLGATSGLQKKSRRLTSGLQELTADGHTRIVRGRRSLSDSTVRTFDRLALEVCANLQRIWCMCTDVIAKRHTQCQTAFFAAREMNLLATAMLKSLQLHRKRGLFNIVSRRCKSSVGTLIRQLCKYWQENGEFAIDGAVPRTSDIMLRACLGIADRRQAAPRARLLFGQAIVTFKTPYSYDVAVTRDGHVLLAAADDGLLVYSGSGQRLSSWRPNKRSSREDDMVMCVAALSDGRAVVGVSLAQLVVLLKQSKPGGTWLEDRRVAVLQSHPQRLAVHSDLLASVERRLTLERGRQVKLIRLSTGHLLYTQSREYDIGEVALSALCLLTVSYGQVKRNSGVKPYVLDAFSHSGEFLWRHETSDEETLQGLCASEDTWRRVYAVMWRGSSSRVMAISGSDGRQMTEVMNSRTHGLQDPLFLSLSRGQKHTVLAVLSMSGTVSQYEVTIE